MKKVLIFFFLLSTLFTTVNADELILRNRKVSIEGIDVTDYKITNNATDGQTLISDGKGGIRWGTIKTLDTIDVKGDAHILNLEGSYTGGFRLYLC